MKNNRNGQDEEQIAKNIREVGRVGRIRNRRGMIRINKIENIVMVDKKCRVKDRLD
jgi:hypothetical protein